MLKFVFSCAYNNIAITGIAEILKRKKFCSKSLLAILKVLLFLNDGMEIQYE